MVFSASLRSMLSGAILVVGFSAAQLAFADAIPYTNIGSYNVAAYSFTAAFTGDIVAYFVGGIHADYENKLGLLVNGVDTGIYGLDNHTSSVGDSLNFGSVSAGTSLVFILQNLTLGASAYSDPSLNPPYDAISGSPNPPGNNHIYSTTYTATSPFFPGVPTGPYVAFEDIPFPGADFNYDDESFVFTNVVGTSGVPEPGSVMLLVTVVGLIGLTGGRGSRSSWWLQAKLAGLGKIDRSRE